jgi:hypothetical protein
MENNLTKDSTSKERQLVFSSAYPSIAYDGHDGSFFRIKPSDSSVIRKLEPSASGMLSVFASETGKMTNRKACILAWELLNSKKLPDDCTIYFKNLNQEDFTAYNLGVTTKIEFKQLKDALDNLEWALKIIPDAKEVYSYKVRFKFQGCLMLKSFHDIVAAKKFKRIVIIKSTKLVSKYLISA